MAAELVVGLRNQARAGVVVVPRLEHGQPPARVLCLRVADLAVCRGDVGVIARHAGVVDEKVVDNLATRGALAPEADGAVAVLLGALQMEADARVEAAAAGLSRARRVPEEPLAVEGGRVYRAKRVGSCRCQVAGCE